MQSQTVRPRPSLLQPIVGLTVVTHGRHEQLTNPSALETLASLWRQSSDFDGWYVGDYLLMPDHVHLFARASHEAKPLPAWIATWTAISARRLEPLLRTHSPFWERSYFDRFLRIDDCYGLEWEYVSLNPVRQSLCAAPDDWPWKGRVFDLTV
ncbi:transposase [Horticoccus sp. 23ND18S-11]|uniref:transposase n=1 Tax=Horticoccus sp. 23ND18S-11 TaxID=3391832 RepID=UPI0039C8C999